MAHYFNNLNLKSNKKRIFCNINGKIFQFITDKGVFSKDRVDPGSILLIKNIIKNEKLNNKKILDVGCGYGIIGIVLKSFGGKEVYMIDINKKAVSLAKENAKLNDQKIEKIENLNLFEINEKYDLIICNPPIHMGKEEIFKMIKKMYSLLNENGAIYLVIMTRHGGKTYFKELKKENIKIEEIDKESGYRIFKIKK